MKKVIALLLGLVFCVGLCACNKTLSEEEVNEIIKDHHLGEEITLDDYTPEQQEQIKDAWDKDGYTWEEKDDGTIVLKPKDPVSEEEIGEIIGEAVDKGKVDLDEFNPAQQEQIKDKLEEEGFAPVPDEEDDNTIIVTPPPVEKLTDEELVALLATWEIGDGFTVQDDYSRVVDLSEYGTYELQQIKAALGTYGIEMTEGEGGYLLKAMTIHFDDIKDNPNE